MELFGRRAKIDTDDTAATAAIFVLKLALTAPAGMVTLDGTVTVLVPYSRTSERATTTALDCAVTRLTVQVPDAGLTKSVGAHVSELIRGSVAGISVSVKLADVPFTVATSTTLVDAVTALVPTVKEALLAPAGIVKDEGTVTSPEPPAAPRATLSALDVAAPRLTVHAPLAGVTIDDGVQASFGTELVVELPGVMVSVPPVALPEIAAAAPETAVKPVNETVDADDAIEETLKVAVAIVPLAMAVAFRPHTTQRAEPVLYTQDNDFPAEVAAGPAVSATLLRLVEE